LAVDDIQRVQRAHAVHHGRHGQRHQLASAARTRVAEVGILTVGVVTKPFEFEVVAA
jgi:cell division GTPase FtsZ